VRFKRILITGGAGFVGANLAVRFKRDFADVVVTCVDNLMRRGSELNLPRLREHGVEFVRGDLCSPDDCATWPEFDLLIDCAADPSVQSGVKGSPLPVLQNNLVGTIHCLEEVRRRNVAVLFLSTSRVYPIAALNDLPWKEEPTRFAWTGAVAAGIDESFPLVGPRSFYGATKLAAELLIQEYAFSHGMPAIINRCGILAGPWQMGRAEQGVVALWVARHVFGRPLRYTGFSGTGKQLRDMLHVDDLYSLLLQQIADPARWRGDVYNVGGGAANAISLCELTELCRAATGKHVPIESEPATSPVDLRIYLTDASKAAREFGWRPERNVATIVDEIAAWVVDHADELRPIIA